MCKLTALLAVIFAGILVLGMTAPLASTERPPDPSGIDPDSSPSVTCIPFGLYGDITTPPLVDRLSDSSDNLTFVGTTNGLYVVGSGGKLHHFLYSPFGIRFVNLIDDITGDGIREVVVVLNDTQVPALRCYDGATWEKRWQFAPAVKVWDRRWVKLQLAISDIEILNGTGSQNVVITAGRCVFSVDARDGQMKWEYQAQHALRKIAEVADLNGDEVNELFIGSEEGDLYLLNGKNGDLRWQTRLPECEDRYGNLMRPVVNDILVTDGQADRAVVASKDGMARLFDLSSRSLEWESAVFGVQSFNGNLRMALVPDAGESGPARVIVMEGSDLAGYATSGCSVALLDSDGTSVWKKGLPMWGHLAPLIGSFGGKPVILTSTEQQIRMIDLADGESAVKTIPVENLDKKAAIVTQLDENRYLLVSSLGDMTMVSAAGEQLWCYPRIDHITALNGGFVGDSTTDTLFCCEWDSSVRATTYSNPAEGGIGMSSRGTQGREALQMRSLQMMDGATRTIAWSYEIPPSELITVSGVKGIRLAPDLVGSDNVPDIIGYRGETVFIFGGVDGKPHSFEVGQTITSIDILRNGASGWAFAVGVADRSETTYLREYGFLTVDCAGTTLWATTYTDWIGDDAYSYSLGFTVLDDINSDSVSDLAVSYPSRIVVLTSIGGTATYELSKILPADNGWKISSVEVVPDSDNDGIRELAYLQKGNIPWAEPGQPQTPPPCPLLCVQSLDDGQPLFKVALQGGVQECSLACGDFDGDGYADSVFLIRINGCGTSTYQSTTEHYLQVISGRDGRLLWNHACRIGSRSWSGIGSNPLPAVSVGNVGEDGTDDLARIVDSPEMNYSGYSRIQSGLEVWGVKGDSLLHDIAASPSLLQSQIRYNQERDDTVLPVDIDHDGNQGVIFSVIEPKVLYRPQSTNPFEEMKGQQRQVLAIIDPAGGRHLASFTGFIPSTVSVFDTNQTDCLGLAACGAVNFLNLSTHLQVTSPEDGAKIGPSIDLRWEGTTGGEFVQVFVDGVCNYAGNDSEVGLYLGRGEHEIVIRSVDDYGRISYGPSDLGEPLTVKVTPSPWKPVLLMLSLFVLLAVILLLFTPRLHRMWRARQRSAKA